MKLSSFCTNGRTFSRDSLETTLNTRHRAPWSTSLALQEEQPRILLQNCFRWTARVTRYVFLDVTTQHILNLFRLEAPLNDQLGITIDRTTRTQFRKQEIQQMFRLTMQRLANFREIGEWGLLCANFEDLGRLDDEFGLCSRRHVRIFVQNYLENAF